MVAVGGVGLDELVGAGLADVEVAALDDGSLKALVHEVVGARARLDAVEAAAIVELDARGCYRTERATDPQDGDEADDDPGGSGEAGDPGGRR
jgi:hypothetical protein